MTSSAAEVALDLASLVPSLPALAQGGLLAGLLGVLLRVMYVERREHREDVASYRTRIAELEQLIRDRAREHEQEIDLEITKRRAAEENAANHRAGWPLKAAEGKE